MSELGQKARKGFDRLRLSKTLRVAAAAGVLGLGGCKAVEKTMCDAQGVTCKFIKDAVGLPRRAERGPAGIIDRGTWVGVDCVYFHGGLVGLSDGGGLKKSARDMAICEDAHAGNSSSSSSTPDNRRVGANCQNTLDELLAARESRKPRTIRLPDGAIAYDSRGGGYSSIQEFDHCTAGAYASTAGNANNNFVVGSGNGTTFRVYPNQTSSQPLTPELSPPASAVMAALSH
jgi:hypothetical protein